MELRERILEAAARVYAEAGFRGATTRRIASEAGVNEVTLFRQFGSKSALIGEAIGLAGGGDSPSEVPELPEVPRKPEPELRAWAAAHLRMLRERRTIIL